MKATRIDSMEKFILKEHSISIEDLCEKFNISKSTARRDLNELVKRGTIKKVYGGIQALDSENPALPLLPFEERDVINSEAKKYICRKAAELIQPHDVIFLDTGTTCVQIIDYIKEIPCTVITNGMNVVMKAFPYENISVIILPGRLNRKTRSFTGHDIEFYLRSVNIQKAFMASTGISIHGGLTNASEDEYMMKKSICKYSNEVYLLVDHEKFGRTALYTYSDLKSIHGLITDMRPPKEIVKYCMQEDIRLIY